MAYVKKINKLDAVRGSHSDCVLITHYTICNLDSTMNLSVSEVRDLHYMLTQILQEVENES